MFDGCTFVPDIGLAQQADLVLEFVNAAFDDLVDVKNMIATGNFAPVAVWVDELDRWFDGGPESEDIVLIKVTPNIVAYWNGEDGGELLLD